MKILIIGGDRRMNIAKQELESMGYFVDTLGLIKDDNGSIKESSVVLLGVPTTRDGQNIFCPQSDKIIPLEYINEVDKNTMVLSCGYNFKNINCIDYLKLDDFCLLNAVPTAEGAIARAIADTPFCLWKSRVLVIGHGRVAKILIDRLVSLKCEVTVSARKRTDFSYLDAMNIKHIYTSEVERNANKFDIIFNTIDVKLFNELDNLKHCYLYDLSTKGCVDFEKAQKLGINAVKLSGIPGKIAPYTAGKIIAQTTNNLIGEWLCKT